MPDFLVITLSVMMCIFVILGCGAAMISAVMLFQISTFMLKLAAAIDALRVAIKQGFDSQTEGQEGVLEGNIKISNQNSQTLMDTMMTLAQMLELVLKGLGYTASPPAESGLKDLAEQKENYGAPRAPKNEDGLTFSRK